MLVVILTEHCLLQAGVLSKSLPMLHCSRGMFSDVKDRDDIPTESHPAVPYSGAV